MLLFALEPQTQEMALRVGVPVVVGLLMLIVGMAFQHARNARERTYFKTRLSQCAHVISKNDLIEDARYKVLEVLAPIAGTDDTSVTLILEAFHGDPTPKLLFETLMTPGGFRSLLERMSEEETVIMHWRNATAMFE